MRKRPPTPATRGSYQSPATSPILSLLRLQQDPQLVRWATLSWSSAAAPLTWLTAKDQRWNGMHLGHRAPPRRDTREIWGFAPGNVPYHQLSPSPPLEAEFTLVHTRRPELLAPEFYGEPRWQAWQFKEQISGYDRFKHLPCVSGVKYSYKAYQHCYSGLFGILAVLDTLTAADLSFPFFPFLCGLVMTAVP